MSLQCAICLHFKHRFNVLHCGHEFCTQCCQDMLNAGSPTAQRSGNAARATFSGTIECHICRSTTICEGDSLKIHISGHITCCQCDTEKLTKEFFWCHICNKSVCSSCFIDNHVNTNGIGFHEASQWDSYKSAKAVVSRLKQMSLDHTQITKKCKTDVTRYLDGLNIYVGQKLEAAGNANQRLYTSTATAIAAAYGISQGAVENSNPISDSLFQTLVNDVKKVAHISSSAAGFIDLNFQQLPYSQLEGSFLKRTVLPFNPSDYDQLTDRLSNLQSKLINTEFVGLATIGKPIDLVVLSSKEMIILDAILGPHHYCNSVCELISIQLPQQPVKYDYYGQPLYQQHTITVPVFRKVLWMPHNRDQLMVTAAAGMDGYVFYLLGKGSNNKFTQWHDASGKLQWQLPIGGNSNGKADDNVIVSTEHVYKGSGNCLYVYDHTDKLDFSQIFQSTYPFADFTELCHVQEEANTTDFYFTGITPRQLEILQLGKSSKKFVSWRSVNLSLLSPDMEIIRPMMYAYGIDGSYLIRSRQPTKLFSWNVNTNAFKVVADFRTTSPQAIQIYEKHMYMVLSDNSTTRIERVKL